MSFKRRRLWISIITGAVFIGCLGAVTWSFFTRRQPPTTPQSYTPENQESSEGFKIDYFKGKKKVYQVSIGSFSVDRAKLGPFQIGPLFVAHLKKVVVDMYTEGLLAEKIDSSGENDLSGWKGDEEFSIEKIEGLFARIKENALFRRRKISIIEIGEISLNLWDNEQKSFSISSDRATMDRRTGDIIFVGHSSLEAAAKGKIIAHRIRWVKETSLFHIKDTFIFIRGDEKIEGSELVTDYQLEKIKYQVTS